MGSYCPCTAAEKLNDFLNANMKNKHIIDN